MIYNPLGVLSLAQLLPALVEAELKATAIASSLLLDDSLGCAYSSLEKYEIASTKTLYEQVACEYNPMRSKRGPAMMMEHLGIRWGYVFLRSANYLNSEEFSELMVQAVEMYLAGEPERKVKHESYEGRLFTEGRYEVMGGLGGSVSTLSWKPCMAATRPPSWSTSRPAVPARPSRSTDRSNTPWGRTSRAPFPMLVHP